MGDKKLTIQVDAKVSPSVQALNKTLDDFAARGNKVAKAFQNVSGVGPQGQQTLKQGGLAKALLQEKKLFDDLGKSGERLAKVLTDQVSRSQATLTKQLEVATKNMDGLVKKHEFFVARVERLKRRGDPERTALAESYRQRAFQDVAGGANELIGLRQAAGINEEGGGAGGLGGSSFTRNALSMVMGRAGLPGASLLMSAGNAGAVAAAGLAGATIGFKMAMSGLKGTISSMAGAGGLASQELAVGIGFDARTLMGAGGLALDPRKMRDIDIHQKLVTKPWEYAKSLATQGLFGWDWSGAMRSAERNVATARGQAVLAREGEIGQSAAPLADIANYQMARQYQIQTLRRRFGSGTFEAAAGMGAKLGIDPDALRGYLNPLAQFVGARQARGYLGRVAGAELAGMDPGAALNIIGQTAVSGANVLGASAGMDPTIRAILGSGVGETMGARSMMYAGAGGGLAEALPGAVNAGGPMGVRQAQQAVLGAQMYGQVMGGHDPFQKSYNIAAATAALGKGSDPYTRNFLATQMADPKVLADVLRGRLPAAFSNMGISLSAAQMAAHDIDRGLITSRFYDTGADTPAMRRMREAKKAGGLISWGQDMRARGMNAAQRERAIEEIAPLLAQVEVGLTGGDVGGGEALARMAAGLATGHGPAIAHRRAGGGAGRPEAPEDAGLDAWKRELKLQADTVANLTATYKDAAGVVVKMKDAFDLTIGGLDKMTEKLTGVPVAPKPAPRKK
ncbi:MAG: hypothetical protein EPO08_20985 [Rhodospirillaceae bacterium]|nr:MAG: hypothetical protein EPO08_20985 [Rhodospirillaceae bacterium]